ncbi:MAG: AAA family ATPase, partial [Pirellula sp.]|nr:AAA family ATPase [Pirellula sp.]
QLIQDEGVKPSDITIVYNSKFVRARLEEMVAPVLKELGAVLSIQTNQAYQRSPNVILATTSASFKGYDSEVIIIPGVDFFRAHDKGVLASSLYVAMTRARSILTMFAHRNSNVHARKIFKAIDDCLDCLQDRPEIDVEISPHDDMADLLQWVGPENQRWLQRIWSEKQISQEPIFSANGELIAEPLFWFRENSFVYACFGNEVLTKRAMQKLVDFGVRILPIGGN